MRTLVPAVLLMPFLILMFVSYPAYSQDTGPSAFDMIGPGSYYDQNISFYLMSSRFKYSYLPLFELHSNRLYQILTHTLTHDDGKYTIFSNLMLNKVQFKSDNIYFDFEGKITQNLTYNLNFDINTGGIYVGPIRLGDLNYSSIPNSTFTLHYYFD